MTRWPVLASLLVSAACGSSSDNSQTTPPPGATVTADAIAAGGDCPTATGTGVAHSGIISASETWTAADSPHHVTGHVLLRQNAVLTVEPCAVVLLDPGLGFDIGGSGDTAKLVARGAYDGTTLMPVVFAPAQAGTHWGMVRVGAPGSVDFELTALIGAADPSSAQNGGGTIVASGPNVAPLTPMVRTKDVVIEGSAGHGVNLYAFASFTSDSAGLYVRGGADGYPVRIGTPAVGTLPAGDYTGNVVDQIFVDTFQVVRDAETFRNRGVPYRLAGRLYVEPTSSAGLATLTLEPGVTVAFERTGDSAIQLGSGSSPASQTPGLLVAAGTAAAPITFTSAENTPAPDDWAGVFFDGSPATGNVIDHAVFEYAGGESSTRGFGCGPMDNDAAVIITDWRPDAAFIQNTLFRHVGGFAAVVLGWTSDASGPDFTATNTFEDVPGCHVTRWADANGSCPGGTRDQCF